MNKPSASPHRQPTGPRSPLRPLCLAIAVLCSAGLADAADLSWKGGKTNGSDSLTGRMSIGANWNQNAQPAPGDTLHFGSSSYTTVTNDLGYRIYNQLSFEAGASAYTLQGVGNNIGLTNGIVNKSSNVQLLDWGLTAGFVISANQTWDGGTAGMSITGGMDQQHDLTLSNKVAYKQLGATAVGYVPGSPVTLTINSGSSHSTAAAVTVGGVSPTSSGIINVHGVGSSFSVGTDLNLGDVGSGTLLIDAGASATSKSLVMGKSGTAKLTVDGAGSSFNVVDATYNNSDVIVSGGGKFTATGNMGPGFVPNVNSSVTVKDTGTLFKALTGFYLGIRGNGLMQVSNGAAAETPNLFIGDNGNGGVGVLEVSGVGSTLKAQVVNARAGLLNVASGAQFQVSNWMTLGQAGDASFAASVGGSGALLSVANALSVGSAGAGRVDILGDGTLDVGQLVIGSSGVVNLQGGTLRMTTGKLSGTLNWDSGTLNFKANYATGDFLGHDMVLSAGQILKGDAQIRVGAGDSLSFAGGVLQANGFLTDANGSATVGRSSSLTATNIQNNGRLVMDGGSVNGSLVNAGTMSGSGYLRANLGQGGFNNGGRFDQGDYVELANSASNTNSGVWTLGKGGVLQLNSSNLNNQGSMTLAGASIAAFDANSTLSNGANGSISGNGTISAKFANQGTVIVDGGKLSIDKGFSNGGQIQLTSAIATLSGGTIANSGRIEGLGQIGNTINNQGMISAKGGTLTLAASVGNSGTLTVGRDATLLLTQGLQPNTGKIQLAGGTFDNNGRALINQAGAVISGYGDLRSGALSNSGLVLLSGGVSAVYADVVANADSQIILSGNSNTTFYGTVEVKNGAELRVSEGSVATFAAAVKQRNGADVNGDGKMYYEGGLSIGNSPGYGYIQGSVTFASSNKYFAEIGGVDPCTALSCAAGAPLLDSSFDKLVVGGKLKLGGTLVLTSWNGFVAQAGQSFDLLDWGSASGSFKSIDATGFMHAAGTQLDYSQLYTHGEIRVTAVPEPHSYALMLAGIGLLAWRRRKNSAETS
ncbi:PEP-CTERM sorting domain-containing protein [Paucibacter sp. APW11]|uniref:PEP-CTERM sorting domain-containing protein n=1 Tax=Roseateles aquae TaxID=3077235 RepID=A0ABU3PIG5_9BURK|nr:PEP-CTERM sorting domain-containing protein [Paucibacter sp. APW11]MDT9002344.1 PEP-CTERM sorting domain-containing protein [Paucibacter sp. APW11]